MELLDSVSDLITLKTFAVSSGKQGLSIYGEATIIDPVPEGFQFQTPELPFDISISGADNISIRVASLRVEPLALTRPNITLHISGSTTEIGGGASSAISDFVGKYLAQEPAPILLATPILPNVTFPALFPAPAKRPDILRDVTIRDMKLKALPNGSFVASGMIFARVTLPDSFDIDLSVHKVWPEVLVFNGEVPDSAPEPAHASPINRGMQMGIPDPLPQGAFGHIKPDVWLPSVSMRVIPSAYGSEYIVTANVTEVPLEILPGRNKEFSNFVSKVRDLYCVDSDIYMAFLDRVFRKWCNGWYTR